MKKWIGLFLIGTMFFSSLAFAFISGFDTQTQNIAGAPQNEALPTNPIVDYRLSPVQFEQAMSIGLTVVTYRYEKTCLECADQRAFLEQIVTSQDFGGQVILEEVESAGPASLEVNSNFGGRSIDSIDQESAVKALCEFVASPPLGCVAMQNLTADGSLGQ
ncbi:MAG: hypothetical protein HY833_03505 [Candidatus Aenigmarchaeota archaeon]|nr:hypothetical protein [Candidatus Aenigmarchaeota archaeon]